MVLVDDSLRIVNVFLARDPWLTRVDCTRYYRYRYAKSSTGMRVKGAPLPRDSLKEQIEYTQKFF
jgi:hypothetical protein